MDFRVYASYSIVIVLFCLCRLSLVLADKRDFTEDEIEKFRSMFNEPKDEEYDDEGDGDDSTYHNTWIVGIDAGDSEIANNIAQKYGFTNLGQVAHLDGVYKFLHPLHHHDEQENDKSVPDVIAEKDPVSRSEQVHTRTKRDHIEHESLLRSHPQVKWVKRERILLREKRAGVEDRPRRKELQFDDPRFVEEWYIKNTGQTSGPPKFDSKVYEVWEMGYTGKGVVISVLDDGMDHTHPDLKDNYDPKASTDLNGRDRDPFPNDSDSYNAHGTKCAGTIAAKANNHFCGVGIAYDAKIGAIRMLDGKATDSLEADALSFNPQYIDIYSCSWGPKDNGKTFGRPGKLGRKALEAGAAVGRNGLGSIYVWATGNGGMSNDDCNADGYVDSIYTISVGSVNNYGVSTYYCEQCSSTMTVTYCSGSHKYGEKDSRANVITTYLHHQCTSHFVGTSSAAPLAAGIFALVLQANPKLTWRDMQHLVVETADLTSPLDPSWRSNGAGHHYNAKFGFGVLNALKMVKKALTWKTVPEQRVCHFPVKFKNKDIPSRGILRLKIKTDGCQTCLSKDKDANGKCKHAIMKLEHVVVTVTLKYRKRGDLSIELYSPHGSKSKLLHRRHNDDSTNGLKDWAFMTVYNWGENPKGVWVLKFMDKERSVKPKSKRFQRDMEEVYVHMLDRQKRKSGRNGNVHKEVFQSDDDAEEPKSFYEVPDATIYKRAFDELREKYSHARKDEDRKREVEDDREFKDRDYDDEEDYAENRSRRALVHGGLSLDDSPVAGMVDKIEITLYGTAE